MPYTNQDNPRIESVTADTTLTAADSNKWWVLANSAGPITFTLPSAAVGLSYRVSHSCGAPNTWARQQLKIRPATGDKIQIGTRVVEYDSNNTSGGLLTLEFYGVGLEIFCPVAGTWLLRWSTYGIDYGRSLNCGVGTEGSFSLIGRDTRVAKTASSFLRGHHIALASDGYIGLFNGSTGPLDLWHTGYAYSAAAVSTNIYSSVADSYATKTANPTMVGWGQASPDGFTLENLMYVLNGQNVGAGVFQATEHYNLLSDTWTARSGATAINGILRPGMVFNGIGYLLAGWDLSTNAIAIGYNSVANTWTNGGSCISYTNTGWCALAGYGLVFGGGSAYNVADRLQTYSYNTVSGAWQQVASLTNYRAKPVSCATAGRGYVAGGYLAAYVTTAELFNPASNVWTAAATCDGTSATATIEAEGYAFIHGGGYNSTTAVGTMKQYN